MALELDKCSVFVCAVCCTVESVDSQLLPEWKFTIEMGHELIVEIAFTSNTQALFLSLNLFVEKKKWKLSFHRSPLFTHDFIVIPNISTETLLILFDICSPKMVAIRMPFESVPFGIFQYSSLTNIVVCASLLPQYTCVFNYISFCFWLMLSTLNFFFFY